METKARVLYDGDAPSVASRSGCSKFDWLGQLAYVNVRDESQPMLKEPPVAGRCCWNRCTWCRAMGGIFMRLCRDPLFGVAVAVDVADRAISVFAGMTWLGQKIYLWIARNRFGAIVPCEHGVCKIPHQARRCRSEPAVARSAKPQAGSGDTTTEYASLVAETTMTRRDPTAHRQRKHRRNLHGHGQAAPHQSRRQLLPASRARDVPGAITARLWNANEPQFRSFSEGDFLRIKGKVQLFQGARCKSYSRSSIASIRARYLWAISYARRAGHRQAL